MVLFFAQNYSMYEYTFTKIKVRQYILEVEFSRKAHSYAYNGAYFIFLKAAYFKRPDQSV